MPTRRRPPPRRRSTPAGEHRAVLLDEVLRVLGPMPGEVVVDCTVGWAGHAVALLQRIGPNGLLLGLDLDADNLPRARERLTAVGHPFRLRHGNFAALETLLAEEGIHRAHVVLADLGMSSMQLDDAERGFSYVRNGALDMRMDRSRGKTAAQVLECISFADLKQALTDLGDEPQAHRITEAILAARDRAPIIQTQQLARIVQEATGAARWRLHPSAGKWNLHPAARTFQALRILVNRELGNLGNLLRVLPACLLPGGRAGIISFHSGEDRLVKRSFREGHMAGLYRIISDEPVRPGFVERQANPRSRSAKLRWAVCV